ncbi:MAG: hypothetical protein NZ922_03445 [Candidatus Methanomethyliaceae archaeon]|nr:hypothetical protein [Candidatus Methanomethyliaceae archaeon]MDW7970651.1 hypothetical protein [Nitrososphaerota archaeon]
MAEEESIWRSEPLDLIILDLLRRKDGSLKEDELLEMLKSMVKEISLPTLNKILMKMELSGKISVSSLKKGKLITMIKRKES